MRGLVFVGLPAVVMACGTPYGGVTGELGETGWFDEPPAGCSATVDSTVPTANVQDHLWSDPLVAYVSEDADTYAFRLVDGLGRPIPLEDTVDATGLVHTLRPVGGLLPPDSELALQYVDCTGELEVPFRTSALGVPLDDGPTAVRGLTYRLDLQDADWVEPAGASALLSAVLAPILLGVRYVDDRSLAWMGGLGRTSLGKVVQDTSAPTWAFPAAAFDRAPWLESVADDVEVRIADGVLRIYDFSVRGTFARDGLSLQAATVTGLGDTRNAAGAVGSQNPGAICELALGLGVDCVPCPDGEVYCLPVHVRDVQAPLLPGVVLKPVVAP